MERTRRFLEAVAPILEQNPKAIAFIAGSAFEGEEWRVVELEKKISQLKVSSQVRRIDYYANTTELYNMFDILYFQVLIQTLYQRLY